MAPPEIELANHPGFSAVDDSCGLKVA